MMLYERMMDDCAFMEKVRTSDGLGGYTTAWTQGETFKCAIHKDTSTQARIAEADGVLSTYTLTVSRSTPLEFNDVIMRLSDSSVFKVTSNMKDNTSPEFSGIDFGQVSAKPFDLNGEVTDAQ